MNIANEQEMLLQCECCLRTGKQILILCECCLQAREIILLYEYAHPVNMTKERKDTVKQTWI